MEYREFDPIKEKLKKTLDLLRYEHTIGVMYTAGSLAMAHGQDIQKAMLAGLLHDCAKCLTLEEMIQWCDTYQFPITQMERGNKNLLHAKAGTVMAKQEYHINDPDVLRAICYHATGTPDMSALDKIVYIADYIEPGRNKAKNLESIRKAAFRDLDAAMMQITMDTLDYLRNEGQTIDPATEETYHFYKEHRKEMDEVGNVGNCEKSSRSFGR